MIDPLSIETRDAEIQVARLTNLLSAALDEIYRLRRAMAFEARVVEAHYEGYKTFPKTRRPHAEAQVARMRQAVVSPAVAYADVSWSSLNRELQRIDGASFLTVNSWEASLQ